MTDSPKLTTGASTVGAPGQQTATRTARTALTGRVLVVAGAEVPASDAPPSQFPQLIHEADPTLEATGVVIGGSNWSETLRAIRRQNPEMFLMVDLPANDHLATKDEPFPHDDPSIDALFTPTLSERLDAQLSAGASIALTPTGHVEVGDRTTLKAVFARTDKLDRDDTVVALQIRPQWLTGNHLQLVTAAINRSRHPVAITLCDERSDPMSHPGVLAAVRELAALDKAPMFHRIDLGGIDAMSYGALAASIGVLAGKRRGSVPGKKSHAYRSNKGANVHLYDLARFRRSMDIERDWYARIAPPDCTCAICDSRPVTRFGNDRDACKAATLHNALGIIRYATEANAAGGYANYWPGYVTDAIAAHATLSERVGALVEPPRELEAWAKRV